MNLRIAIIAALLALAPIAAHAESVLEPVSCVVVDLPDTWQPQPVPLADGTTGYVATSPDGSLTVYLSRVPSAVRHSDLDAVLASLAMYYAGTVDGWTVLYRGEWAGVDAVIAQADSPRLLVVMAWTGPAGSNGAMQFEQGLLDLTPEAIQGMVDALNSVEQGECSTQGNGDTE